VPFFAKKSDFFYGIDCFLKCKNKQIFAAKKHFCYDVIFNAVSIKHKNHQIKANQKIKA